MSSSIGDHLRLTIFGQSHSPAIGMTLEGFPAGFTFSEEKLNAFLRRRAPGSAAWSTPRKEADRPEFVSGLVDHTTCGVPLTALIRNTNTRSGDYDLLREIPRPGHADYPAGVKYGGFQDAAGGGHFSGRMTAPLCIPSGICLQYLEERGIRVWAHAEAIGNIHDEGDLLTSECGPDFPTISRDRGEEMKRLIAAVKAEGDSVGGVVECAVTGLPVGLGDPIFGGMENRIAALAFGIPAVKGIEFGDGFAAAGLRGSENNHPWIPAEGQVRCEPNHAGGILGGLTTGMPLVFRVAVKPTPSIARTQRSIRLKTGESAELNVPGRHDPCIVPRAVPCVEAAAAVAVMDSILGRRKDGV